MTVFEMIEAQQHGKENTAPWMVGEQLKEICRKEPHCQSVVLEDLQNPDMSLEKCEGKIKAWADKQKSSGNFVCVAPNVAEGIIRKFYGLGNAAEEQTEARPTAKILSLEDMLEGL